MASVTIDKVRNVNWDLGDLWDIEFPELADASFNGIIPATDVEINFGGINQTTFGNINYQGIGYRTQPTVTITFYDDEKSTILTKIRNWVDKISPYDMSYVYASEDAKRVMIVKKLNKRKEIVKTYSLYVIPSSDISYHGSNDGSPQQFTVSFLIIGMKE